MIPLPARGERTGPKGPGEGKPCGAERSGGPHMGCLIVGVLNCTPDSFSDGGKFSSVEEAVEAGVRMSADGADWIDVGGESTRPGAAPVHEEEEIGRVVPVIQGLR